MDNEFYSSNRLGTIIKSECLEELKEELKGKKCKSCGSELEFACCVEGTFLVCSKYSLGDCFLGMELVTPRNEKPYLKELERSWKSEYN
jgi:hypothetical protein